MRVTEAQDVPALATDVERHSVTGEPPPPVLPRLVPIEVDPSQTGHLKQIWPLSSFIPMRGIEPVKGVVMLHPLGRGDAEEGKPVGKHLPRRSAENKTRRMGGARLFVAAG